MKQVDKYFSKRGANGYQNTFSFDIKFYKNTPFIWKSDTTYCQKYTSYTFKSTSYRFVLENTHIFFNLCTVVLKGKSKDDFKILKNYYIKAKI